jgi:hypothetical protein
MNESSTEGLAVGDKPIVGELEADCDGAFDSFIVSLGGMAEGPEEGKDVGVKDGLEDGHDGDSDGSCAAEPIDGGGACSTGGSEVGAFVGVLDGSYDGNFDGCEDGIAVG